MFSGAWAGQHHQRVPRKRVLWLRLVSVAGLLATQGCVAAPGESSHFQV